MTTKFPSPLLGYNNNVRHKGKVFHIQTEDSGVKYGHIITHLFMDGGRILKSVKTSYTEYLGNERMADIVREMMKQQHKAMFIALRDGKFDAVVEGGATATATVAPKPPPAPGAGAAASARPAAPSAPAAGTLPGPSLPPLVSRPRAPDEVPEAPATIRQPAPELALDMDALERAAAAAQVTAPSLRAQSELPPPPANLFRDKTAAGKYRITPVPPTVAARGEPARPEPRATAAPTLQPVARAPQGSPPAANERRYAPTRPAAIFGQAKPQPNKSVFGEDLLSDKSLDEVILSYLAEDLDEKK